MKLKVVGDGSFGQFLKGIFKNQLDDEADNIILAVPASAYEEVAAAHAGKHLINVCSVQQDTNEILLRHSSKVTGIHPLFGPRSWSLANNTCIVTLRTGDHSDELIDLFYQIRCLNTEMTAKQHDELMARVHAPLIELADQIKRIVENADDVMHYLLPPSFKKLKDLNDQLQMSDGTKESIKSNPYAS